ncbi:hypothetical protein BD410DRAFT_779584 [Rickenella mellea]|uniref:Glucosidase 2 subunit beta n=1 Tax=Rickenella mellea TaxID=50990 RepID=A0A4R5XFA4_9AGAM|nr:hypothetical protein BD410DRAFT_779584 [Rickenella mellea]
MLSWLLFVLPIPALAALDKAQGVPPYLLHKYVPLTGSGAPKWRCLDDSKEIPWHNVNDDFCDCPDGSDEPGTSACPDNLFYCRNDGHIGVMIPSSRVNDGLCEPECCDGSDEPFGFCPNVCKEVGEAYKLKLEAENKLRRTGSKIRSTYVNFAQKEKKRLEALVVSSSREVADKEKEVARLKDVLDRTESLSAAALEFKQKSPMYRSLIEHSKALKSLQREHVRLKEKEQQLADILSALRTGYNPNYQDMAVLEAVRGWEHYSGIVKDEPITEEELGTDGEEDGTVSEEVTEDAEAEWEKDLWTTEELETKVEPLLTTDYVNLLLEHDNHIGSATQSSTLFHLHSYLPDFLVPHYDNMKEVLVSWLELLGIAKPAPDTSNKAALARMVFSTAEQSLTRIKKDKQNAQEDLARLFDPEWYGKDGEWKKLHGSCLKLDTGEYTYEVCLFKESKQIPNHGGQTFSLGRFHSWHPSPDVEVGSPEYYTKQVYSSGARCWNGPERSTKLILSCGTENALLSVSEPEKCEYQFIGTTPALCLPLDSSASGGSKEEL